MAKEKDESTIEITADVAANKINAFYLAMRKYAIKNQIPLELAIPAIVGAFMSSLDLDVLAFTIEEDDDGTQKLRMTAQGISSISTMKVTDSIAHA